MTERKSTPKRQKTATSTRRPSVKARARFIINDAELYSEETRHAITNALEGDAPDLAEMVRRAEAGEEILDISRPLVITLPLLPPLDWEAYIQARAARWAARHGYTGKSSEHQRSRNGYATLMRRNLKQWTAVGNIYADVLTNPDTPRSAQDALWEDVIDPIMDAVQINFSDPELLRVLWPLLLFLDKDDYSGGWNANPSDDEEEGER